MDPFGLPWFKEIVLKGPKTNYWCIKTSQGNLWCVNKLIEWRHLIYPMIKRKLGNGMTTQFWYDNWSPFGQLDSYLKPAFSRLGISRNATVSLLCQEGNWLIPPARSETQLLLQIHLTTTALSTDPDYYEWEIQGKVTETYFMGSIVCIHIFAKKALWSLGRKWSGLHLGYQDMTSSLGWLCLIGARRETYCRDGA